MKELDRAEVLGILTEARLRENDEDELYALIQSYPSPETREAEVREAVTQLYSGVTNGFLSDVYEAMTGRRVEVVGAVADLCPCPCCGLKSLDELYDASTGDGYDICEYCGWEDVGVVDPDTYQSVNRGSMSDYRARIEGDFNRYYRRKWISIDDVA